MTTVSLLETLSVPVTLTTQSTETQRATRTTVLATATSVASAVSTLTLEQESLRSLSTLETHTESTVVETTIPSTTTTATLTQPTSITQEDVSTSFYTLTETSTAIETSTSDEVLAVLPTPRALSQSPAFCQFWKPACARACSATAATSTIKASCDKVWQPTNRYRLSCDCSYLSSRRRVTVNRVNEAFANVAQAGQSSVTATTFETRTV